MVVSVHFFGSQRTITGVRKIHLELGEDHRVSDVCFSLMERYPELPLNEESILITVNNEASSMNHILSPDDHITFLPHVGGG